MSKNKRFKLLTYPKFQLSVLASILFADVIIFAAILYRLHVNFEFLKSMGQKASLPENHIFFESLIIQEKMLSKDIFIVFAVSLLFTVFFTLYLSNKITGPIIRLKSHLEGYLSGKQKNSLSFRENDYFTDIPPLINKILKQKSGSSSSEAKGEADEDDI